MTKKITCLVAALLFVCMQSPPICYGFDLFPGPPGHTIVIAGVVKCVENGVEKPEEGAAVTIRTITDGAENGDYDLPEPETAVTDKSGFWVMKFKIPLAIAWPGRAVGEIVPKCKTGSVEIYEPLEPIHGLDNFYSFMTGKAGNLADLVKRMVTNYMKLKLPTSVATIDFVSNAAYIETVVMCGEPPAPPPVEEKKPQDTYALPQIPETPQEETEPPPPVEPVTPQIPDTTKNPQQPPVGDTSRQAEDEYARCVDRCKPILDGLKPLKKRLEELEKRKSDKVKKLEDEVKRLESVRDVNLSAGRQQKYLVSGGGEHWGSIRFEEQYKENRYDPVSGTERMSPERQKFIDMINKKLEAARRDLDGVSRKEEKAKEKERKEIEGRIAKIQKEYEDCIKDCDRYLGEEKEKVKKSDPVVMPRDAFRYPDAVRMMTDFYGPQPGAKDTMPQRPKPQDPTLTPPGDAVKDAQPMPMGPAEPLTDSNGGFDKVPPVSTDYYTTHDPNKKYEAPPLLGTHDLSEETEVPGETEAPGEEVQYKRTEGDRMTVDTAVSYKPTPEGMDVTAASVATGKGSDFRRWKVDRVGMDIDGEKVAPEKEEDFYIEKESYYREAAAVTFAAIGSQYRRCADEAQSGEVCPVTGQKKEAPERKDTIGDGIDRAGMAAGMGLLASQARGSIPAKKSTFKLNKDQAKKVREGKGTMRTTASNETAHQVQTVKTRLY